MRRHRTQIEYAAAKVCYDARLAAANARVDALPSSDAETEQTEEEKDLWAAAVDAICEEEGLSDARTRLALAEAELLRWGRERLKNDPNYARSADTIEEMFRQMERLITTRNRVIELLLKLEG